MELPFLIRKVGPKDIAQLQTEHEGDLLMGKISGLEFEYWKTQNAELIESDTLRYEYNFLTQNLIIKCMATPVHDSLQYFFTENSLISMSERFGRTEARSMVHIGSGTTFEGFTGDWSCSSQKLPDAFLQPVNQKFPSVICKAGFAESIEELMQDVRLWLLHTMGLTRIAIVLCFTEASTRIKRVIVDQEAEEKVGREDTLEDEAGPSIKVSNDDEQTVLDSINESTKHDELTEKLFDLNKQKKLKQPLLGNLEATLYVYKTTEDGSDIVESFSAVLFPPPPVDSPKPMEFGISLQDMLGSSIPEGNDPSDQIMFSLAILLQYIERSISFTEHQRASRRAKKLLQSLVGFDDGETFAQRKRQRQSPLAVGK